MNILSLFDGMSCARIALERAGMPVTNYYASEIDKYAIEVSKNGNRSNPIFIRPVNLNDTQCAYADLGYLEFFTNINGTQKSSGENMPDIDYILDEWEVVN